jgi:poly-gamma-glutamate synthase PgsB/CapB
MHFVLILFLVLLYLIMEKVLHDRRVKRIPIRIHVNGTRGKSSVVRLIAAALREAGVRTLAKTTGIHPLLIYPDGHEERIRRRGPSRIQEQMGFIRKAAKMKVDAVVVECMALDPPLQFCSETKMIKSTVGVITNVRQDHFEAMGRNLDSIAQSLSQTIPRDGILVTADQRYFNFFRSEGGLKNTGVFLAYDLDADLKDDQEGSLIFRENTAIARKVCSLLGEMPFFGISDQGSSGVIKVKQDDTTIYFIDAFSANDIDSTKIIQDMRLKEKGCPRPFIALLNNRADRPLRMLSFAFFLSHEPVYDYIMLIGDHQRMVKRHILKRSKRDNIVLLKSRKPEDLIEEIYRKISRPEFTLVGMGNEKGPGEEISRFFTRMTH